MTIWAQLLTPPAPAPEPPAARGRGKFITKYNHAQMISDRLAGMSWREIGIKHEVVPSGGPGKIGPRAKALITMSWTYRQMTPEQQETLQ